FIHPHRMRVVIEQQPVLRLRRPQLFSGAVTFRLVGHAADHAHADIGVVAYDEAPIQHMRIGAVPTPEAVPTNATMAIGVRQTCAADRTSWSNSASVSGAQVDAYAPDGSKASSRLGMFRSAFAIVFLFLFTRRKDLHTAPPCSEGIIPKNISTYLNCGNKTTRPCCYTPSCRKIFIRHSRCIPVLP
ncbi:MAG: hypothetical protein V7642_3702, partial [Burkholderiales bacterium]